MGKKKIESNKDPLNSEAKGINPLTEKKYSTSFKNYIKKWKDLPVYQRSTEFLDLLDKNDVVILESGTGSGKSVIIPKLCLYYYNYEKRVAMTVPKQILASRAAEYASLTLDSPLKEGKIGYTHKGSPEEFFDKEKNVLEYTTDGKLLSKVIRDVNLSDYECILIDEAHERNPNMDFLLLFIRSAIINRRETKNPLKLVVMSATMDIRPFLNYFEKFNVGSIQVSGAASLYEVQEEYWKNPSPPDIQYIDNVLSTIKKITEEDTGKDKGDVLVFVTSKKDSHTICEKLAEHFPKIWCKELYSGVSSESESLAVDKDKYKLLYPKKDRKVVVATDIAESSITVDNLKYVIDNGKSFKKTFNPYSGFEEGKIDFITEAQFLQRRGRTGRTRSGFYYGLYSYDDRKKFESFPEPKILKIDLTENTLTYLKLFKTEKNIREFYDNLITPPKKEFVDYSFNILFRLGLLNKTNGSLNKRGNDVLDITKNITNNVFNSVLYERGQHNKCLLEIAKILFFIEFTRTNKEFENIKNYNFDEKIGDFYSFLKNFDNLSLGENNKFKYLMNDLNITSFEESGDKRENIKKTFLDVFSNIYYRIATISNNKILVNKQEVKLSTNLKDYISRDEKIFGYNNLIFLDKNRNKINYIMGV